MIWKLQKKTLLPLQIFGYGITLCIGITVALITLIIYTDLKPILESESDVFDDNVVIVEKNKAFSKEELTDFKDQDFVKEISEFESSNFKIDLPEDFVLKDIINPSIESIPDKYLDIESDKWKWEKGSDFIPIMLPEYLFTLIYNNIDLQSFIFLPKKLISTFEFDVTLSDKDDSRVFRGSIVGFSSKINSILVPSDFLSWANKEFDNPEDDKKEKKKHKILVELNNPTDARLLEFLNENNYKVNKEKMEKTKLLFFFKMAFVFVFVIALVIILLSIVLIILSINLIFQKNKEVLINLYFLGYQIKQISYYYKLLISIVTFFSIAVSLIVTLVVRKIYSVKLVSYFDFEMSNTFIYTNVLIVSVFLLILLNVLITRKIRTLISI
jgi:hypothetical protein